MPTLAINITLYVLAFGLIWIGSGLIVNSVTKLSHHLGISSFFVSFVILGILTTTPEIAVGLSAVSSGTPGIFVGNLLGGIPVLFLLVIPVLAILGRGIHLNHNLDAGSVLLAMLMSLAPFVAVLDRRVSSGEGIVLIGLYGLVVFLLHLKNRATEPTHAKLLKMRHYTLGDVAHIFAGMLLVLFASNVIVSKTIYFSQLLSIAPFYLSLIVLSFGTNLPELTLVVRSLLTGKKDIALGDYLGSAAANGFLLGIFTLMSRESVVIVDNFWWTFVLMVTGLGLFYHFARTKRTLSPGEGLILLGVYTLFIVVQLLPH